MRVAGAILSVLVATAAMVGPVAGQALFEWPDTAVDLSEYSTVEECLAAVSRAREALAIHEERVLGIWRDTVATDPGEWRKPIPGAVVETARWCAKRFAEVESTPLSDFRFLLPLYVIAGWEETAKALIDRRLAAIAADDEVSEVAAVLDTIAHIYGGGGGDPALPLAVRPPRLDLFDGVLAEYLPRLSDRVKQILLYWTVLRLGSYRDPAALEEYATRIEALTDSLSESERERLSDELKRIQNIYDDEAFDGDRMSALMQVVFRSRRQMLLDSLRHSTAAYVRFSRDTWARASTWPAETYLFGMPVGERAPTLEGDYWLGCGDPCTPRPAPGRVSLVVFYSPGNCTGVVDHSATLYARSCARVLVPLRQLEERFPELETTVVARTHGHFSYLKEGVTPEREAELTRRWLDSFGVRAALSMTDSDYWRLPSPDRRRIDNDIPNVTAYRFGETWQWSANRPWAFLIDEAGMIVHAAELIGSDAGEMLAELIEVLLERQRAQS